MSYIYYYKIGNRIINSFILPNRKIANWDRSIKLESPQYKLGVLTKVKKNK